MKTQEIDNELKNLIKGIKLDSPGNDFSSNVMNRVFEEKIILQKAKDEKILGKGFWIILLLFVILFIAMFAFSSNGTNEVSQLSKLFIDANEGVLSQGYQSFFSNLGTLPLSIGGILLASSILLFADLFLPKILANHVLPKSL